MFSCSSMDHLPKDYISCAGLDTQGTQLQTEVTGMPSSATYLQQALGPQSLDERRQLQDQPPYLHMSSLQSNESQVRLSLRQREGAGSDGLRSSRGQRRHSLRSPFASAASFTEQGIGAAQQPVSMISLSGGGMKRQTSVQVLGHRHGAASRSFSGMASSSAAAPGGCIRRLASPDRQQLGTAGAPWVMPAADAPQHSFTVIPSSPSRLMKSTRHPGVPGRMVLSAGIRDHAVAAASALLGHSTTAPLTAAGNGAGPCKEDYNAVDCLLQSPSDPVSSFHSPSCIHEKRG